MTRTKDFDPDIVLDKAADLFRRQGYEATSVRDIEEHTGIGRGSLYGTFGSKHDLFISVLDRHAAGTISYMVNLVEDSESPLEGTRALFEEIVCAASSREGTAGCLLTNTAAELAGHDSTTASTLARSFARLEDSFYKALRAAQASGQLSGQKDPLALARFLVSSVQGLRVVSKVDRSRNALEDVKSSILSALD